MQSTRVQSGTNPPFSAGASQATAADFPLNYLFLHFPDFVSSLNPFGFSPSAWPTAIQSGLHKVPRERCFTEKILHNESTETSAMVIAYFVRDSSNPTRFSCTNENTQNAPVLHSVDLASSIRSCLLFGTCIRLPNRIAVAVSFDCRQAYKHNTSDRAARSSADIDCLTKLHSFGVRSTFRALGCLTFVVRPRPEFRD